MTISTLTASHAEVQQDLLKTKTKITALESNIGRLLPFCKKNQSYIVAPKERELAQKETDYQQLQATNKKLGTSDPNLF